MSLSQSVEQPPTTELVLTAHELVAMSPQNLNERGLQAEYVQDAKYTIELSAIEPVSMTGEIEQLAILDLAGTPLQILRIGGQGGSIAIGSADYVPQPPRIEAYQGSAGQEPLPVFMNKPHLYLGREIGGSQHITLTENTNVSRRHATLHLIREIPGQDRLDIYDSSTNGTRVITRMPEVKTDKRHTIASRLAKLIGRSAK